MFFPWLNALGIRSSAGPVVASLHAPTKASWRQLLAVAVGVWGLSVLGLMISTLSGQASPVWPAAGLGVWSVLRYGRRALWSVLIGALLSKPLTETPWWTWISVLGPVVEAGLGAFLIQWVRDREWLRFEGASDALGCLLAALVASVSCMIMGVGTLWLNNVVSSAEVGEVALTWWIGDVFGILLVVPLLDAFYEGRHEARVTLRNLTRAVVLLGVTGGACWLAFWLPRPGGLIFAVFPPLLLGCYWAGRFGGHVVALVIALWATLATAMGRGPFFGDQLNDGLLRMGAFLASVMITALVLPLFRSLNSCRFGAGVLLSGWGVSAVVYHLHWRMESAAETVRLEADVDDVMVALRDRMTIYTEALRGGEALFNTLGDVDHEQWRRFANSLQLRESFPGINGIGVIWPVDANELPGFLDRMRRDHAEDFELRRVPGVEAPEVAPGDSQHLVIGYIEPEPINRQAIGLDVGSESNRRHAALAARDSGKARMTKRIVLVQDGHKRAGFLLYLPVYRAGASLDSVEERRAAFRHWIYAPFVTEQFVQGVLPNVSQGLALDFFEGSSTDVKDLLYGHNDRRDAGPAFGRMEYVHVTELSLAGERFTLGWHRTGAFTAPYTLTSLWIGSGLALASLAAAALIALLRASQNRAEVLVKERTFELEQAQARMADLIALQRGVLDSNNFAFISVDLEGIIRSFNRGAERLLGYEASEVIGRCTPERFHLNEEVETQAQVLSRRLGGRIQPGLDVFVALAMRGLPDEREWTYVRRDGTHLPVLLSITAIRNQEGEPTGFLGVAQDLSDRKQAEASRRAAMVELSVLKQALDQQVEISVADLDGRIVYANAKFCQNSGYSYDELMGQTHQILNSGEHSPEFFEHIWRTISTGSNWHGDIRNRAKSGRLYWVDTLIVPEMDHQGEPRRYVSIRTDVTRNRDYEQDLARSRDEAVALSRLKSEFLANVSHELRTPLNGVIGMSDLLAGLINEPGQRHMVDVIRQSSENLLTIINDILDLSKIEAGKMRLSVNDFDLAAMLRNAIELLVPRAESKHVSLRCEIPPQRDWVVAGDEGRLRQVVINLLGNAIKFTDAGTVCLRLVERPSMSSRCALRIEVEDTGCGIPRDMQSRLFEAFVQVDGSDSRAQGGTGLGLSISRQIVELMGGRIGMESELGRGSTFWVDLSFPRGTMVAVDEGTSKLTGPRAIAATASSQGPGSSRRVAPQRALSILLVEDNPANQEVASLMLERSGHAVTIASNGAEGLELLGEARFDVVLMDCQMPVLDGFAATRRLRAGEVPGADRKVPVIALTAYAMEGDRQRCLQAGMDDYLTKPLRMKEVAAALDGVMQRLSATAVSTDGRSVSDEPDLDEDVVRELSSMEAEPGVTAFAFVAEQFIGSADEELADLEAHLKAGAWSVFADSVHRFGGSAVIVGGQKVRRIALQLEMLTRAGNVATVGERWPELPAACARFREALQARLRAEDAAKPRAA